MSCCCGRQGFGARQRGTMCTVWRMMLDCSQDTTVCCKKSQSCAPEDGQKFARNMLSWSWRSINCYCSYLHPSYRTRSATLPRSEPLPTTTTGHYTICCKKPQSCAPEDGQKFARNMLSWSWRSIKLLLLHLVGSYITLPIKKTQFMFLIYACIIGLHLIKLSVSA